METRKKQSSVIPSNFAEPPTPLPIRILVVNCFNERRIKRYYIDQFRTNEQKIIDANFLKCTDNANNEAYWANHACRMANSCSPEYIASINARLVTMLRDCDFAKIKSDFDLGVTYAYNWERINREYASCCAANPGNCKDANL